MSGQRQYSSLGLVDRFVLGFQLGEWLGRIRTDYARYRPSFAEQPEAGKPYIAS